MDEEERKRKQILEINRDTTLTQQEKSQRILQVLAGKWLRYSSDALSVPGSTTDETRSSSSAASGSACASASSSPPVSSPGSPHSHHLFGPSYGRCGESSSSSAASSPAPASSLDQEIAKKKYDLTPSFRPGDGKVLGCKHYFRGAKLLAACCDMLFTCRFCHDEYWNDHKIVRYETKTMLCMHCCTLQPIQQFCPNCNEKLGEYYCPVCKFHDSTPNKSIYHCNECGLCRVGERDKYFHCNNCHACYQKQPDGSTEHECHNLDGDCPICGQNLFTSTGTVTFMRCGHPIHQTCLKELIRTNFACPVCRKSLGDTSPITREIDLCIAMQPMPEIFRNTTVNVLCNDCLERSSVPFHFLGAKCASCMSYNTSISSYVNMPTREQLEASSSSSASASASASASVPGDSEADAQIPSFVSSPIFDDDDDDYDDDDEEEEEGSSISDSELFDDAD